MTDKLARQLIEKLEQKVEQQSQQITALRQQLDLTHVYIDPKDFPPAESGPFKWNLLPSTNLGPAELHKRFEEIYAHLGVKRVELSGVKLEKTP